MTLSGGRYDVQTIRHLMNQRKGVVYYLRISNRRDALVKIGYSEHLLHRLSAHRRTWPTCTLLAVEDGSLNKEYFRHSEFDDHRVREGTERELFRQNPRLAALIFEINTGRKVSEDSAVLKLWGFA